MKKMIFSRLKIGSFTMFRKPASRLSRMGPLVLDQVFVSSSAGPHAEITWKLCKSFLLAEEEVDHLQVHTNDPVVLVILE